MSLQTEKARRLPGLPTTDERSNWSIAQESVGKPDALGAYRREEFARLQRHPGFELLRQGEARIVSFAIKKYLSPGLGIFASQATIADAMGLHEDTVNKALRAAVKAGLFTVEHRGARKSGKGGRTSNRYRLVASEANTQGDRVTPTDRVTRPDNLRAEKVLFAGTSDSNGELEVVKHVSTKQRRSTPPSRYFVTPSRRASATSAFAEDTDFEIFDLEYEEELGLLNSCLSSYASLPSFSFENKKTELVGIEPPRSVESQNGQVANDTEGDRMTEVEGVVRAVQQEALSKRYLVLLEDGREFALPLDRVGLGRDMQAAHRILALIGSRVRFPVRADGSIAARPKRVEDEAPVEPTGYPEKLPRDELEQPPQAEDDRPPWEVAWEREAQQTVAEEPPWERLERKIDEIPITVANLTGNGPVQEAEQILADAEEGESND